MEILISQLLIIANITSNMIPNRVEVCWDVLNANKDILVMWLIYSYKIAKKVVQKTICMDWTQYGIRWYLAIDAVTPTKSLLFSTKVNKETIPHHSNTTITN